MFWIIIFICVILFLAWAMKKATKNTPFKNNCGCTPNIDHLRWLEKGEKRSDGKRENLW